MTPHEIKKFRESIHADLGNRQQIPAAAASGASATPDGTGDETAEMQRSLEQDFNAEAA